MPETDVYSVKADAVLTGEGLLRKAAVLVAKGMIKEICSPAPQKSGIPVLEYSGHTLTPCFCDHHLHFFQNTGEALFRAADSLIKWGIIKVYEGGSSSGVGINAKRHLKTSLDIQSAGYGLSKKGTYGSHIGKGIETVAEAKELIDRLNALHADYIKIIHSGIFRPEHGDITTGGFTPPEVNEIVHYAKEKGLPVACHANGEKAVREAVDAGVSSVIHGLGVSEETLAHMAERGVTFIPTVAAFARLSTRADNREAIRNIHAAVEGHLSAVEKAYKAGVRVLPGSDSGPSFIPYGRAYQEELFFLQRAGLPEEYILSSAAAAELAEKGNASFLLLRGLEVREVFINGVRTERTEQ